MGLMSARVFEDVFDTVFLQQGLHGKTEIYVMDRPPASRAGLAGDGVIGCHTIAHESGRIIAADMVLDGKLALQGSHVNG